VITSMIRADSKRYFRIVNRQMRKYDTVWKVPADIEREREEILQRYSSERMNIHILEDLSLKTQPFPYSFQEFATFARIATALARIAPSYVPVPDYQYHLTSLMYAMGMFAPKSNQIKIAICGLGYQLSDERLLFDYSMIKDEKLRNDLIKFPNVGILTEKEPYYGILGNSPFVRVLTRRVRNGAIDDNARSFLTHHGSFKSSGIFSFEVCLTPLTLSSSFNQLAFNANRKIVFPYKIARALCKANMLHIWGPILLGIANNLSHPLHVLIMTKRGVEYVKDVLSYLVHKSNHRVIFSGIYHPGHTTGNNTDWNGNIMEFCTSPSTFPQLKLPNEITIEKLKSDIANVLGDDYEKIIKLERNAGQAFFISQIQNEYNDNVI
jgi:hypothetical protein